MAISKEKQAEVLEQMKQAQKKRAKNKGETVADDSAQSKDMTIEKLQEQVRSLSDRLEQEKDAKQELADKARNQEKAKRYSIERDAVNDILFGNVNRFFEKEYSVKVANSDSDYKFNIKMHAPTAIELGQISSKENEMLKQNKIKNVNSNVQSIFDAIATFSVLGDECPDWFKDPNKVIRWDILMEVYNDFLEWQNTFLLG